MTDSLQTSRASSKRITLAASLCFVLTHSHSKRINACLPVTVHPSVLAAGRLAGQVMMRCMCADERHSEPAKVVVYLQIQKILARFERHT